MKNTLENRINLALISLVLMLAFSVAPGLASEKIKTSSHDPMFGLQKSVIYEDEHDSEWAMEEQPGDSKAVRGSSTVAMYADEHDSEWAMEEQPGDSKAVRGSSAVAMYVDEHDSEWAMEKQPTSLN